jgi:hypothetical protein
MTPIQNIDSFLVLRYLDRAFGKFLAGRLKLLRWLFLRIGRPAITNINQ